MTCQNVERVKRGWLQDTVDQTSVTVILLLLSNSLRKEFLDSSASAWELMQCLQIYHTAERYNSSSGQLTSACEAHPSLAAALINVFWMGPPLTSKQGAKTKTAHSSFCSFELHCAAWTKPPCCDVREQWWQYTAQRHPRVNLVTSVLWTQLCIRGSRHFHVTGYSGCLERLIQIMQQNVLYQRGWDSTLLCWGGSQD